MTGSCDLRSILYDADIGGNQVGSILTTSNMNVSGGLFTAPLDFGAGAFNGQARWLDTSVRCPAGSGEFTPLVPRHALTAAPYALYASNAGSASTAPWSGLTGIPAGFADGVDDAGWSLAGNAGTSPSSFLGTTDNITLTLAVSGTAALRLVPNATSPHVIGGSSANTVAPGARGATISGGGGDLFPNTAGDLATVGGGALNKAPGSGSTAGGGTVNTASGPSATVGGGTVNTASADTATVGGGTGNVADGLTATIGGGGFNRASGWRATVPGGGDNVAGGDFSFAAGRRANIDPLHDGTFLFADQTGDAFNSAAANEFAVRASGGARFVNSAGIGVALAPGGTSWSAMSDRSVKANFAPVNGQDVLARVAALPLSTWNLISQEPSIRHMGPVAQDFYAAFGLGEDERFISTVDADGVALAAIQGLYQLLQEKDAQISQLQAQNTALEERDTALEARLAAVEALLARSPHSVGADLASAQSTPRQYPSPEWGTP